MAGNDSAHIRYEDGEPQDFGVIGQVSQVPEVWLDTAFSCISAYTKLREISIWEAWQKAVERNELDS